MKSVNVKEFFNLPQFNLISHIRDINPFGVNEIVASFKIVKITEHGQIRVLGGYCKPKYFSEAWIQRRKPEIGGYLTMHRNGTFGYMSKEVHEERVRIIADAYNSTID